MDELFSTSYQQVAVVTHGGVIRTLVCAFLGMELHQRFSLGHPLENCSITTMHWDASEKRYYLNSFNDSAHLKR